MDLGRPQPIRPVVIKPKQQPENFFFIGLIVTMFRKHLFPCSVGAEIRAQRSEPWYHTVGTPGLDCPSAWCSLPDSMSGHNLPLPDSQHGHLPLRPSQHTPSFFSLFRGYQQKIRVRGAVVSFEGCLQISAPSLICVPFPGQVLNLFKSQVCTWKIEMMVMVPTSKDVGSLCGSNIWINNSWIICVKGPVPCLAVRLLSTWAVSSWMT